MNFSYQKAKFRFNLFDNTRLDFYEDFSAALADQATDTEQLKKMMQRARKRRTGWAPLYEHWLNKMKRMSFAQALQHTVPDHEVMILTAAEEDARLPEGMTYLVRAIKISNAIKSAYFAALISPILGLLTTIGFLFAYALLIAPALLQVVPLNKWPTLSAVFYHVSHFIVYDGWSLLVGLILGGLIITWSRPNWRGPIRAKIDRIAFLPWKTYRINQSINFLVTLAILLQGKNHGMQEALLRMRTFSSPWLSWHITRMLKRLALTPDQPAKALDTGFFESDLMDRIEDYSERSDFFSALKNLAFNQSDQFLNQANRRAMVSGYIALLIIAAVSVGIVMGNFEMNQAIQSSLSTIR